MDKKIILKAGKSLAWFIGFPMLSLIVLITMMPMLGNDVMGDFGRNWILITLAIWAFIEIVRFILNRKVAVKSDKHRKVVLMITVAVAMLAVLLPSVIYDAVTKDKYEADRAALAAQGVDVRSYDSLTGWHRGFTSFKDNDTYYLIDKNYDFMKAYGLSEMETSWYGNADKENNLGKKLGTYDKVDELIAEKAAAQKSLDAAEIALAAAEEDYALKEEAYVAAKTAYDDAYAAGNENPALEEAVINAKEALDVSAETLVKYKGQRVVLTDKKDAIVSYVFELLGDKNVFPDGLKLNLKDIGGILGMSLPDFELPVDKILDLIDSVGGIIGLDIQNMVKDLIPDVIYTGMGPETVDHYQAIVDDTYTLGEVRQFDFEITWYPTVLAAARVKYIGYIMAGLVALSLIALEFLSGKEKELAAKQAENA